MKKTLAFFILLFMASILFASTWYLGGEAGYALNFMSTVNTWPDTKYLPGHGAEVAFMAEYDFDSGLSLHTGLRYAGKSFYYYHENEDIVYSNYMEMDHFLEIPFSIRYTYDAGDVGLFLGFGGYVGTWFLSQYFGSNISIAETGEDTEFYTSNGDIIPFDEGDNRFEAGILAEAGISLYCEKSLRLDFTLRYEGNMTSLVKNYQRNTAHRYDDTLFFTISCMFPLGSR